MDEEKWEGEGEGESGWILGWEGFDGGLCMLVQFAFCGSELGIR